MLCPLHASYKLPNENSESQAIRKGRVLRGYAELSFILF